VDGAAIGAVQANDDGALQIAQGATVSFDTYFNAVFERHWRLYTCAGALTLSLQVEGRGVVRIWRRSPDAGCALVHEQNIAGPARITLPLDAPHYRQAGLLWFDLTALGGPAVLLGAQWSTPGTVQPLARLGVVICTFNREPELGAVLAAIAGSEDLGTAVARVVVVNQKRPGLATRPGVRAAADGFGRGLLEALDDPAVTHACLLDDDVRVEPESRRRMAAFFSLAQDGIALGGHMLDSVRPTSLYEAGAVVLPNWAPKPLHHGLDLCDPDALDTLLSPGAMHFNGWWMFGFPKQWIERVGMPLPCFIRGDDIEFGMRLHEAGLPTVSLPGVAIWHEPFYLKLGGWQLYYETRNALACAALHQDFAPNRVALLLLKRLLIQLLTYRYYSAALIVRAVEDSLHGPAILDGDPRPLHASLAELRSRYPDAWTRRERVLAAAPVGASPWFRLGFVLAMARALLLNWFRASPADALPRALRVQDLVWFRVMRSDCLAVDTHWDCDFPTFRRSQASFRRLLAAGLRATWQLRRAAPELQRAWQAAFAPHVAALLARLRPARPSGC